MWFGGGVGFVIVGDQIDIEWFVVFYVGCCYVEVVLFENFQWQNVVWEEYGVQWKYWYVQGVDGGVGW